MSHSSHHAPNRWDPSGAAGRPLRVLLVMAEASGGIAGHVASLSDDLAAAGCQVVLATTPGSADRLPDGLAGVQVVPVLRGGTGTPGSLAALRPWIAGADVVHAHGHQAGAQAVLAAATLPRRRPPVVITWHNALLAGGVQAVAGQALERLQVAGADLITGASSDLVERAAALGAHAELSEVAAPDLTPWPGEASQAKSELAARHGLPDDRPWVLTVSRIAAQKNLPVLIEAAARDQRAHPHTPVCWVVVGAGDDELRSRLQQRIDRDDLPVHLIGASRSVRQFIAAASVLALPSEWEARSLVVQEALAGGLPCVVSDAGGLPDLVGDAGVLVPVGDPVALAAAVRRIVDDPSLVADLARRSRARAAQLPDAEQVCADWLARYRRLQ